MRRFVRLISLTSLISAEDIKKNIKMRRFVLLILLTSLISAVEIKNKCKNYVFWASYASNLASKLSISSANKK